MSVAPKHPPVGETLQEMLDRIGWQHPSPVARDVFNWMSAATAELAQIRNGLSSLAAALVEHEATP